MSQTTLDGAKPARVTRDWSETILPRVGLMLLGLIVLAVGGSVVWLRGGRYVSVDDSYIRAAKVVVATDVSGIVARVAVKEGQIVHEGDELFRLDDRPFRIALDGARAGIAQAKLDVVAMKRDYQRMLRAIDASRSAMDGDEATFNRFASLVKGGGVTRAEYDDARFKLATDRQTLEVLTLQAQVQLARLGGDADIDPEKMPAAQQAQSRIDELQRQLDHTVVRAPFDGIATQVDAAQPGLYLAAATPGMALVSTTRVWAEGNPKETELTLVKPGDPVEIAVDTYPGHVWHGTVETVAPASGSEFSVLPAQNTSGNWVKVVQRIPVRVHLDRAPGDPDLRAGMSVTLSIDTGHVRSLRDLF